MTWKRARAGGVHICGSCRGPIAEGEVYAKTRIGHTRCAECAEQIEPRPDVIEDDDAPLAVPDGVTYQASMGFISAGELARQRVSSHLRNRQRGAR